MPGADIPLPQGHLPAGRHVAGKAAIVPSAGQRIGAIPRADAAMQAAAGQGAGTPCGGAPFARAGGLGQPALVAGVIRDNPAMTEDIFGPVATLLTFTGEAEAMASAAHPTYGPAAGFCPRDASRALRQSRRLEAGTVRVSRQGRSRDHILPTGGRKASGPGKDLGRAAYPANRRSTFVLIDL
ncbi:aldehyde dehydrogenase family protein [Pseudooceanicola sp. 216_PA32_1]|uniref:Aldehyde dehydrogenase family protein n=1 Tax=Pseudooceanicola pacificus TaxID=2676438 RepID=A0A844WBV1_9RHOB|nr:aldehyde dehydrogenase family protein [Pseudooceanicola pacificus]MWB78703.1 aldehyde dehydrogenase family protein [Pseudooceanicola pacificus]